MTTTPPPSTADRLRDPRLFQGLAALLALLVVLQAFLAGRHLFFAWTITVHGVIGNVVFPLTLVLAALAFLGRADVATRFGAVALVVLVTAQVGLGYAGRTSLDAAALHVPNGVLTCAVAAFLAARRPRS